MVALPWEYRWLPLDEGLVMTPPGDVAERMIVFLDCGNIDRMPVDFLQADGLHVLNIDHHHDNTRFGTVDLVCPAASSTAEIVWRLSKELDVEYRVVQPNGEVRWFAARGHAGDGEPHRLAGVKMDITARKEAANGSPWVFPHKTKCGHITEPKNAWARICKSAKLSDLRIHDLRRTLGSWQAAGGSSLHVIGKSLGHRNQATTAIYARLNLDPVRESVNRATAAILAAGHVGFALSSTAAALAIMRAVTDRRGPSPLAFVVVPMVGAFFIDIANALVIQGYLALPMFGFPS